MPLPPVVYDLSADEAAISQQLRSNELAIEQEIADRIAAIAALQAQITGVVTGDVPIGGEPPPGSVIDTDAELHEALDLIHADVADLLAQINAHADLIAQEAIDRVNAINDLLDPTISNLTTSIGVLNATVVEEISGRATSETAVATQLEGITASLDDAFSQIVDEQIARSNADSTFADSLTSVTSSLNDANAQILLLSGTGVDPEGALASQILALSADVGDVTSDLSVESAVRASADTALSASVTTLSSTVGSAVADLTAEIATRASEDSAIVASVTSLTSTVNANVASITAEAVTRASADSTLSGLITTLQSQFDDNEATLNTELTTRADADSAFAAAISTLTTTVGDNTASVTTLQTSTDGMLARYALRVDVNGRVVGFELMNGTGQSSSFIITADKFQVQTPGFPAVTPFTVTSDGILVNNAVITGLLNTATINNNCKLANVAYAGKKFPPFAVIGVNIGTSYTFEQGGATVHQFKGNDNIQRGVAHKIFRKTPTAPTFDGLVFYGVNNSTVGDVENRLGQTGLTMFFASLSGTTNRNISLWYRVKDLIADEGVWLPFLSIDNYQTGKRTYESISGSGMIAVAVGATQLIEFGVAGLQTSNASMVDPSQDFIYGGSVTIMAFNWLSGVTI